MASNDTNFPTTPESRSYPPARPASSASTWYLVIGAAVLLTVLYMLTTGMMRSPGHDDLLLPAPEPAAQPATQP